MTGQCPTGSGEQSKTNSLERPTDSRKSDSVGGGYYASVDDIFDSTTMTVCTGHHCGSLLAAAKRLSMHAAKRQGVSLVAVTFPTIDYIALEGDS